MNNYNSPCGCTPMVPEMHCNNVVKKCYVEEVPHVVNYNTHVINECVKKHITVPKYTTTEETIFIDEFQFNPYQVPYQYQPMMENNMVQPMMQQQGIPTPNLPFQF